MLGLLYAFIVWLSSQVQEKKGEFPTYFYVLILGSYAIHQVNINTVSRLFLLKNISSSHFKCTEIICPLGPVYLTYMYSQ